MNRLLLTLLTAGTIAIAAESGVTQAMYDYHQGGGVTWHQVQRLSYYNRRQPHRAMRKMLGSPNRIGHDVEVYTIRDTVDYGPGKIPLNAGKKLIIRYGRDRQTATWYVQ